MEGNGMVWGSGENGWLHKMISETILGQVNVWRKLRMKRLGISRWFVLPLTSSSYYGQRPHHLLRCGWLMTTERLRANLKTGKKNLRIATNWCMDHQVHWWTNRVCPLGGRKTLRWWFSIQLYDDPGTFHVIGIFIIMLSSSIIIHSTLSSP